MFHCVLLISQYRPSSIFFELGLSRALEKKIREGFVTRARKKNAFRVGFVPRSRKKILFESGLYQPISKKYFWNLLLIITFDVRGVWRCSCVQNDRTDRAVIFLCNYITKLLLDQKLWSKVYFALVWKIILFQAGLSGGLEKNRAGFVTRARFFSKPFGLYWLQIGSWYYLTKRRPNEKP